MKKQKAPGMGIRNKPYNLLLYFAILYILISFLMSEQDGVLNFLDTYLIVPLDGLLIVLAIILFLFWILYKLTARFLHSQTLTWAHVILTILGSLVCIYLFISNITVDTVQGPEENSIVGSGIRGAVIVPVLAQLIYFVNLFGPAKHKSQPLNK